MSDSFKELPDWLQVVIGVYAFVSILTGIFAGMERDSFPHGVVWGILWPLLLSIYTVKAAWNETIAALRS